MLRCEITVSCVCGAIACVSFGCSGSARTASVDGGRPTDASVDVTAEAGMQPDTCTVDGMQGVRCVTSVATYCADSGTGDDASFSGCDSTWQSVMSAPPCKSLGGPYYQVLFGSCAAVNELAVDGLRSGLF